MVWIFEKNVVKSVFCAAFVCLLSCTTPPSDDKRNFYRRRSGRTVARIDSGMCKYCGHYKVGDPYTVDGKTYYPREYKSYSETGIASWYGDDFHNKKTANGAVFDMNSLSAAHKTLPLPSVVLVTNLENGRSIKLVVNDRGPFVDNRIIDLSKMAAEKLGFKKNGIARIRIELLRKDTESLLKKCLNN